MATITCGHCHHTHTDTAAVRKCSKGPARSRTSGQSHPTGSNPTQLMAHLRTAAVRYAHSQGIAGPDAHTAGIPSVL